jgi:dihydroxyacetone kinase DhaKLM complex PTS-EIIA-like component DhaM
MNFTNELIEKAKVKQGLISDYSIAKMLGTSPQKVSDWKRERSEANAEYTLKLLAAAEMSVKDALEIMNKQQGSAQLSLIFVTALASTLALASFFKPLHCILC